MGDIKTLDPELRSFININSKEDLNRLQTRRAHGLVRENLRLNLGAASIPDLKRLREAAEMVQGAEFSEAQNVFSSCIEIFETKQSFFWAGVAGENLGEALLKLSEMQHDGQAAAAVDFEGKDAFLAAANHYRVEAERFEEKGCRLLAERALADRAWCESWAMGKAAHVRRYPPKVR